MDADRYDEMYPILFRDLQAMLSAIGAGTVAEDVAQETLIYGRAHLGELRRDDRLRPWLRRIASRNASRSRRDPSVADTASAIAEWSVVDLSVDEASALRALSARQLAVVTLVFLLGYRQEEAAELLGVRRGTISATLWQARQRLARSLADYRPRDQR